MSDNNMQPLASPNPLPTPVPTAGIAPTPNPDDGNTNPAYEFFRVQQRMDEVLGRVHGNNSKGEKDSNRPTVTIPMGDKTITESSEALFKAIAPFKHIFYRGGVVVELLKDGSEYDVKILDPVSAQSRFEKYVDFYKPPTTSKFPTRTVISESIAKQYLKSEACRTILPKLNGILHCPMLVEKEGKLHRVEKGYDETTGYFIAASHPIDNVSLEDAVTFLAGMLDDFDFVTPGDRSRAIASLFTPALKFGGLIKGPIPVDVAEANASQSGKTYRQKLVAALYNQKMAVVTKKAGGVGSMEETFNEYLIKGKAFIQFDNVRGKLDSQYLESFMTADDMFSARVPYSSSVMVDPSKFVLFISSNGFEATKDLTNRASIIRIRKREHFQYRLYEGNDILQLAFEWQPLFIGALFTVIEEWHKQGKPRTNDTRHDFREWSQVADWIVRNIFHEAPLMDGHEVAKQRAASPQLSFLRLVAVKLGERLKLNQNLSASELASICLDEDIEIPGLTAETQTVEQGPQQIGRILGGLFKDCEELAFDEFRVARSQERVKTETGYYQTLNRYSFSLVNRDERPTPPNTTNTGPN